MNYYLMFNNLNEINEFMYIINCYSIEADIVRGNIWLDAKSIIGVLSLGLKSPLRLIVYSEGNEEFERQITKFRIGNKQKYIE